DGIPVYRRRGDGALVRFMYMRDAELGEKLFVGPEAREWRTKRAETDTVGDVYELVSKHVLMNLSCDACDESQFWVDHEEHLRAFCKKPVMTLPYGATKGGMWNQIIETAKDLNFKLPPKTASHLRDHIWKAMRQVKPTATAIKTCEFIQ